MLNRFALSLRVAHLLFELFLGVATFGKQIIFSHHISYLSHACRLDSFCRSTPDGILLEHMVAMCQPSTRPHTNYTLRSDMVASTSPLNEIMDQRDYTLWSDVVANQSPSDSNQPIYSAYALEVGGG
ncbi:hypothetical protein I7I53_10756 [Histoplasma capsulatum var. duboisii H88]|uniref:Uncharacterized protein n=1 Tax=Ajellomyces capsulatus (strain H88) TaxID=544711 RepID=A0A8A1L7S6_AJEC8|nr:hypothetical protein I7I53_10756 [Histoplasma capsulatum var. duboisii H88]